MREILDAMRDLLPKWFSMATFVVLYVLLSIGDKLL